jgi:hypothetical protein
MVRPKDGSPVPKVSDVKYSYSGASADLLLFWGKQSRGWVRSADEKVSDRQRFSV